jgi:hypothetical protein
MSMNDLEWDCVVHPVMAGLGRQVDISDCSPTLQ